MSNPFFSIIIPCYNSVAYIEATLDSLKKQTYQDFEVVLVDDHSSDDSLKVAQTFMSQHALIGQALKRDESHYPKGVSGCRNQGIDCAGADWICFLDSDDLFHPEKLFILFSKIQENTQSNVKSIYHTPMDFNDGDLVVFDNLVVREVSISTADVSKEMLSKNLIYTSAVCVHRAVLLKFKFDYDLHGIEDYYLWLNISKISNWMHIDAPLTAYRVRQSSLMGGRRMSYYILQNNNLLSKVRCNERFSPKEVSVLRHYLMVEIMNYYAIISLNRFGWLDFSRGVLMLLSKGYILSGLKLYFKHLKFRVLNIGMNLIKRR